MKSKVSFFGCNFGSVLTFRFRCHYRKTRKI